MNVTRKDWKGDLARSRDLSEQEKEGYAFFIAWYDKWRVGKDLPCARSTSVLFWREVVNGKERKQWQLVQWAEAMSWFLRWVELCKKEGGEYRSLGERLKNAVHSAGARRGLALRTRKTYAGWVARYGQHVGEERAIMDECKARDWLSNLVTKSNVSYATQKQALNALVFFFKDVCGREQWIYR